VIFTLQQALQGYENLSALLIGLLLILIIRLVPDGIWTTCVRGLQRLVEPAIKPHAHDQHTNDTLE
jgi:branched-chain amino acid transport system permease protein